MGGGHPAAAACSGCNATCGVGVLATALPVLRLLWVTFGSPRHAALPTILFRYLP